MKTVETPDTKQLQEQVNKPLHAQMENDADSEQNTEDKPIMTFDDTKDAPVVYGKDLQIPAFIRRQQD